MLLNMLCYAEQPPTHERCLGSKCQQCQGLVTLQDLVRDSFKCLKMKCKLLPCLLKRYGRTQPSGFLGVREMTGQGYLLAGVVMPGKEEGWACFWCEGFLW